LEGDQMLSIEEYIARRKKEDKLNEFDIDERSQNLKICVDYVFECFNNYLNTTEAEEKTVLHSEKLDKYRKQLHDYEPEVREWAVSIYDEYGKQIHRYIGNILSEYELFFYIIRTTSLEIFHTIVILNLLRNCHFLRIRLKCFSFL
jgi:uncharacterized protein YnzC (UPF0291/DUF896 family)